MLYEIRTTSPEKNLARALKKARIAFQMHVFLQGYEVDFLVAGRVAVEVDGYVHVQTPVRAKDTEKDRILSLAGYRVLRFTNDDCRYDVRRCVEMIKRAVLETAGKVPLELPVRTLPDWKVGLLQLRNAMEA